MSFLARSAAVYPDHVSTVYEDQQLYLVADVRMLQAEARCDRRPICALVACYVHLCRLMSGTRALMARTSPSL
jgi:hypothetical protein